MFENVAAVEMALVAEVVVDRGVDGSEFLQGLEVSEPRHRPFPPCIVGTASQIASASAASFLLVLTAGASFPPGC